MHRSQIYFERLKLEYMGFKIVSLVGVVGRQEVIQSRSPRFFCTISTSSSVEYKGSEAGTYVLSRYMSVNGRVLCVCVCVGTCLLRLGRV